jgi:hypothetical protein
MGAIGASVLVYYIVAQLAAGALAGVVFKLLSTEDAQ